MTSDRDRDEAVVKMWMLATMLQKLEKLYPEFSNQVTWEEAHILLADFCLPERLRDAVVTRPDWYYLCVVAHELNIPLSEVYEGFQLASESKKSVAQQ